MRSDRDCQLKTPSCLEEDTTSYGSQDVVFVFASAPFGIKREAGHFERVGDSFAGVLNKQELGPAIEKLGKAMG